MNLEVWKGNELVSTQELHEGSYHIGRSQECEIPLLSPKVSKKHALIVVKNGGVAILDTGSRNGIFVNGILVKKQKLTLKDKVTIDIFSLKLSLEHHASSNPLLASHEISETPGFDSSSSASNAGRELLPKILDFFQNLERKIEGPYSKLASQYDWRLIIATILVSTVLLSVVLSVLPILNWGQKTTQEEALTRAKTVLAELVRENYQRFSESMDVSKLSVEAGEIEPGMTNCVIVDPTSLTILAPAKLFNQSISDSFYLTAIKHVKEDDQKFFTVQKEDDLFIVASPLYTFAPSSSTRALTGVILAEFSLPSSLHATFQPVAEAILFAVFLSVLAFYLITTLVQKPILKLHDKLDLALKGDNQPIHCDIQFPALETLATAIQFAVNRAQDVPLAATAMRSSSVFDAEDEAYIQSIKALDQASSDGLLLLDLDKKICAVGSVLEDLIGIREQYALGQNIGDVSRDPGFAGTVIDLCDRVTNSNGETQKSTLEINGSSREIIAISHKNQAQQMRFFLIVVKFNG